MYKQTMQKILSKKTKNMMKISRIRTSYEKKKILLTHQFTEFRKSEDVFSVMMHEHQNNRNMSWRISNHDQKNQNRIHIRNSRVWKIQEIYERRIVEHDNLCYFVNKKLSVVFEKLQKCNEKQLKNTKNQQIKK